MNMDFSCSTKTGLERLRENDVLPACCGDYCFGMWYYLYVVAFQKPNCGLAFEKRKFDMMYFLLQVLYVVMYLVMVMLID